MIRMYWIFGWDWNDIERRVWRVNITGNIDDRW